MANIKSAKKRAKQTIKKEKVNLARLSEIKTYAKNILKALDAKDVATAKNLFKIAETKIARAKGKGTLKANTAARKISRLSKRIFATTEA